jgi:hypothetical protein
MNSRIDYNYAHFDFDWTWIKDKELIMKGNQYAGMLIILDQKGRAVGMYAYELINGYEENEEGLG